MSRATPITAGTGRKSTPRRASNLYGSGGLTPNKSRYRTNAGLVLHFLDSAKTPLPSSKGKSHALIHGPAREKEHQDVGNRDDIRLRIGFHVSTQREHSERFQQKERAASSHHQNAAVGREKHDHGYNE